MGMRIGKIRRTIQRFPCWRCCFPMIVGASAEMEGQMNKVTSMPIEKRKKIYREALDEIRKNLDEWYRGDKFLCLGHNDGDFLASAVEAIVATAMDEGGGGV